jgi:hypothetical protein
MLLSIVTISDALPYSKWQPDTPLREHTWRLDNYLASIPNSEDEDAFSQFVRENPPPSACCLYFIEISNGGLPHLVYIGSVFQQSAHDRLKIHKVNAKLVEVLQESPSRLVTIRYCNIYADYIGGILPPDPEPLWTFPEDEQERVIRDVEAALIFKLKPDFNIRNKASYQGHPVRVRLREAPWPGIPTEFSFTLDPGTEK